jgi:hypothetical protein
MIVNSMRGPLNWSEYDSAFVTTDANAPAAGNAAGLIHASSVTFVEGDNAAVDGTVTIWFVPLNVADESGSPVNKPGVPSVTPPEYAPVFVPALSAADVPLFSPSRQYATGASCATVCAYGGAASKVAVTAVGALSVIAHAPVPVQPPPLQPANTDPVAATATSDTCDPAANDAVHVVGHDMPLGVDVTAPPPVPAVVTDNVAGAIALNVAVTVVFVVSDTVHAAVPLHPPPDQPVNTEPACGAAANVTLVPPLNDAAHVAPHDTPAGVEVTVPAPVPLRETLSCACGGGGDGFVPSE